MTVKLFGQVPEVITSVSWVMVTGPPQSSVATTAESFGAGTRLAHWTVIFVGQLVITGALVSTKVISWAQVELLPQPSVAFQVRLIPGLLVQLVAAAASVKVMAMCAGQLSVAVAKPVFVGLIESPHFTCLLGGQVMIGAVPSK